jgi:hypothetical protein
MAILTYRDDLKESVWDVMPSILSEPHHAMGTLV